MGFSHTHYVQLLRLMTNHELVIRGRIGWRSLLGSKLRRPPQPSGKHVERTCTAGSPMTA